jgi:lysophospholipase L1-like esterase
MNRGKVYLLRALLLLFSVGLAAVLGEAALRIANYKHGRVNLGAFTQYDPVLGWRIAPNAYWRAITEEYSTVMQYGPKGLRGKDRPYAKPAGVSRIVMLGDSFVDGYTVPVEDRVSEVVEARLGSGTEVINLGVSGYSTDQELLMLESEGFKYQPDLVFLFAYYNDFWMNGQTLLARNQFKPVFRLDDAGNLTLANVPVPRPVPALEDRSRLYAMVRDAVKSSPWLYKTATLGHGWAVSPLPMPSGAGGTADQFRVYQKEDKPELQRVWKITQALLRRMNRESQEHGARLVVFYAPSRVELSAEEWSQSNIPADYAPEVVVQHLARICGAEGIPLIDPTRQFQEARKKEPLSFAHDVHWTQAGHRAAAEAVTDYIQKNGLLHNEHPIHAQERGPGR